MIGIARILTFGSTLREIKIIAIEGIYVKPFQEDKFKLGPGQRIDLLVESYNLSEIQFFEISGKKSLGALTLNANQNSSNKDLKKNK